MEDQCSIFRGKLRKRRQGLDGGGKKKRKRQKNGGRASPVIDETETKYEVEGFLIRRC
jgi:hypothetical protein